MLESTCQEETEELQEPKLPIAEDQFACYKFIPNK